MQSYYFGRVFPAFPVIPSSMILLFKRRAAFCFHLSRYFSVPISDSHHSASHSPTHRHSISQNEVHRIPRPPRRSRDRTSTSRHRADRTRPRPQHARLQGDWRRGQQRVPDLRQQRSSPFPSLPPLLQISNILPRATSSTPPAPTATPIAK